DGIRDFHVTGVQTCALPISNSRRVISSYTAAQMRAMMEKVVLEGTGRKAILEGYSAAGKTGTAQKVDPATGAYSKTKYVGSFAEIGRASCRGRGEGAGGAGW